MADVQQVIIDTKIHTAQARYTKILHVHYNRPECIMARLTNLTVSNIFHCRRDNYISEIGW
jgi:hypothetical protein